MINITTFRILEGSQDDICEDPLKVSRGLIYMLDGAWKDIPDNVKSSIGMKIQKNKVKCIS